ncbi:MAG: serine hydrolase domain-containing protein [Deinococcota bacterium]
MNNQVKRLLNLQTLLVLFCVLMMPLTTAQDDELVDALDTYLQAQTTVNRFMGNVLIAQADTILFQGAYGLANVEENTPNTLATIFPIDSLTKQFTAAAILKLQERGLLDVTDPISTFLPDFPNGENITVSMLLSHSSGIYDFVINLDGNMARLADDYGAVSMPNLIQLIADEPTSFAPGEQYAYNQSGYALATEIVSRVSGTPYEVFLEQTFFTPLGMTNRGYSTATSISDDIASRLAQGYHWDGRNLTPGETLSLPFAIGASGAYSTVGDLYTWYRALENHTVLTARLFNTMTDPIINLPVNNGPFNAYGYGWAVRSGVLFELFVGKAYGHSGGGVASSYRTMWLRLPDATLILLQSNVAETPVVQIATDIVAILNDGDYVLPTADIVTELAPDELADYVGKYELASGRVVSISLQAGALYYQLESQAPRQLTPTLTGEFVFDDGSRLAFTGEDITDGFVLSFAGEQVAAVKMQ